MELCPKLPNVEYWISHASKEYLDKIKSIYTAELVDSDIYFRGKLVRVREKDDPRGVYNSFDHIICESKKISGEKTKVYEKERCARIPWVKAILEMQECEKCSENIKIWEEPSRENKKKMDTLIWCTYTNYVIVLANQRNSYVIKSAYCVLYKNKETELKRNYDKYHKK